MYFPYTNSASHATNFYLALYSLFLQTDLAADDHVNKNFMHGCDTRYNFVWGYETIKRRKTPDMDMKIKKNANFNL